MSEYNFPPLRDAGVNHTPSLSDTAGLVRGGALTSLKLLQECRDACYTWYVNVAEEHESIFYWSGFPALTVRDGNWLRTSCHVSGASGARLTYRTTRPGVWTNQRFRLFSI
jgi:hypothetical protein